MGIVTEDMILESVIIDGFPSKSMIYDYVRRFCADADRASIVSKAGARLRSLVTYGILKEVQVAGQSYYCFPDCHDQAPIVAPPCSKKDQARQYIDSLPPGAQFTVIDVQDAVMCDRCTAWNAVKSFNLSFFKRMGHANVYIKGASV